MYICLYFDNIYLVGKCIICIDSDAVVFHSATIIIFISFTLWESVVVTKVIFNYLLIIAFIIIFINMYDIIIIVFIT